MAISIWRISHEAFLAHHTLHGIRLAPENSMHIYIDPAWMLHPAFSRHCPKLCRRSTKITPFNQYYSFGYVDTVTMAGTYRCALIVLLIAVHVCLAFATPAEPQSKIGAEIRSEKNAEYCTVRVRQHKDKETDVVAFVTAPKLWNYQQIGEGRGSLWPETELERVDFQLSAVPEPDRIIIARYARVKWVKTLKFTYKLDTWLSTDQQCEVDKFNKGWRKVQCRFACV